MSIRLIILDLDGVLVDAREIHYESFNRALYNQAPRFVISREDHLSIYDGLNTTRKLELLTEKRGLPKQLYDAIWRDKQAATLKLIDKMEPDIYKIALLKGLKELGFKIVVASNSIRQTLKMMLLRKGLLEYVDFYLSNEDVIKPKPSSEIYLRAMIKAGVSPKETLIIEDSPTGRKAAESTGATVMGVTSPTDVTMENISTYLTDNPHKKPSWKDPNLNVLIPMAGLGSRFQAAGFTFPKPLVDVNGEPMIKMVIDNLALDAHYIFIVQKEHYVKYNLQTLLTLLAPGCDIVQVDHLTEGAACTTLLAKEFINNTKPLIISNSDQWLDWNSSDFMWAMTGDEVDGGMVTFTNFHPRWSFAKVENDGFISEVAEKKPISNDATCGVYYWKKGADYVRCAERMIRKEIRTNNEFYVAPVFNEAIAGGYKIKNYHIENFYGTGTPEDLQAYLNDHGK